MKYKTVLSIWLFVVASAHAWTPSNTNKYVPPPLPPTNNIPSHHATSFASASQPLDMTNTWNLYLKLQTIPGAQLTSAAITIVDQYGDITSSTNLGTDSMKARAYFSTGDWWGYIKMEGTVDLHRSLSANTHVISATAYCDFGDGNITNAFGALYGVRTEQQFSFQILWSARTGGTNIHDLAQFSGKTTWMMKDNPYSSIEPPFIVIPPGGDPDAYNQTYALFTGGGGVTNYGVNTNLFTYTNDYPYNYGTLAQIGWGLLHSNGQYGVYTSTNLRDWTQVDSITADQYGNIEFYEPATNNSTFYRLGQ